MPYDMGVRQSNPEERLPIIMSNSTFSTKNQRHYLLGGLAVAALLLVILFFYWIRPIGIVRGSVMIFWRHPAMFTLPLLACLGTMLIHAGIKMVFGDKYKGETGHYDYPKATGAIVTGLVCGFIALVVALIWSGGWANDSIYANTSYGTLNPSTLSGMQVRVKPFDVAESQIDASLNSPTNHADNLAIVKVKGVLTWTSVQDPEGFWRSFSHGANGLISVSAQSSAPDVTIGTKETSGNFNYSPGSKFSSNFGWHAHKMCFTCDIVEIEAIPTPQGPVLAAPFVQWEGGWFVKHPVFKGVFVEHSGSGRAFEMLSAKQAEADPLLVSSGHIFPAGLARRMAQAYAYKYGIANKLFTHKGQLDVEETEEGNTQPYLEDFQNIGTQWVTTLKPTGSTFTTGAVITTSAINGQTRIWRIPADTSLIGGEKAIEIVRGQPGLGVTFANTGSSDEGGKFLAIEPRQVFPPGRGLQFLVSVAPSAKTRVSLNVVVDARSQSVVAVFQANASGDADLVAYLNTGKLPASEQFNGSGAGNSTGLTSTPTQEGTLSSTPSAPSVGIPSGSSAVTTLERLLAENKSSQATNASQAASLRAEQADLERLLKVAKTAPKK